MENTSDLFVGISNCHTYQGLRRRSTPLTCTAASAATAGDSNSHCAFFNGHFSSPERRLPVRNPIKVITSNRCGNVNTSRFSFIEDERLLYRTVYM